MGSCVCKTIEITLSDNEKIKMPEYGDKEKLSAFGCKEFNPEVIGSYHREMFRLHDLEDWINLKQNALKMIMAMGYDQEDAEKSIEFILRAYKVADSAVEAQKAGDIDTERNIYNNMLTNFVAASEALHSETGSIKYKIGWYKSARHNKPLLVAYYLFREHLKRFGILHLDVVICTTWVAFWGGYFAHKKHDWEKLKSVMIKYWKYIHKVCPIRPPLQI